ncbi:MAG: DUF1003 domain-containing protein [Sedimentisphaerales bacterium]|nr:DUF1003 domain-containing protein [Sedimentisphaerales bacterium]
MQDDRLSRNHRAPEVCSICGKSHPRAELISSTLLRPAIVELIRRDHPQWSPQGAICRTDLNQYRSEYVRKILESEKGELTFLEEEVLTSLQQHEVLATNVEAELEEKEKWTLGERLADHMAAFGGSWVFLVCFGTFMTAWIVMNSIVLWRRPIDPYPFILLNLVLSCLAAVQAPIIMMSQNQQEAKDRLRSQHDYQVNLKAELEIRHLHEKIDHMLSHQWERLVEIQEIQIELLSELERGRR